MPKDNNIVNSDQQNAVTNQEADSHTHNIPGDNTVKDTDEWGTGKEPMTGVQRAYLKTLSAEAGVEMNEDLTKAEASKQIEELQQKTGKGSNNEVPNQANTGEPE